ncbi:DUF6250 domain-containing protein [Flavobacterium algicola]|uniref:DUF6250 domain-containing protein n=1 Tax=Flavobacterium algicola TaxID=556529 RepID=UPI001EFE856F|nr:DUF6250 domain-containing protein [Flavobacterium algicola]MCG9793177.1 DUF6250 domain-containing protein [Flavobacterium algicola]
MKKYSKTIGAIATLLLLSCMTTSCGNKMKTISIKGGDVKTKIVYTDDFSNGMDNWLVEQMPQGKVFVKNDKLEVDDVSGCTIWFKEKLTGSIVIEYDVFIIQNGGSNDRVSDLNCFWMATDPRNPTDLFADANLRGGKFSNYDSLQLYYIGVGGNDNKTTRFRRYVGNGERPLLPEHDLKEAKFMLEPNKKYHIKIVAHDGIIQYYRDNEMLVDFEDSNPYTSGYFGLRTVKNHMTFDNFKVYQIQK